MTQQQPVVAAPQTPPPAQAAPKTYVDYILPPSIISRLDVARLVTEVEWVDGELTALAVRAKTGGAQSQAGPVMSGSLEEFLTQNQITIADSRGRSELINQLRQLKDKVPIIHMTFATPIDRESLQQLAAWVRSSVHRQAVIAVGLQPALVAGVYLRTTNRVFDLSMRSMLQNKHGLLITELEALRGSRG